ncbi:hypothetical protein [Vitiosangium sp. GDMCC 1.1324]|uniref:hypothetical protein n=1 Tax=Vitiosangium sp. (strain GDMCC 1.1324) TaxID=2138576 RepID=UPI000D38BF4D|nr:hypothetical protein [Vitiosangium sp. GDMCC 1.1324]PTL78237.1 hypothetical protein DAT35_39985 [Vitiosangium sp. GDMCC 1.1324]
MIPAASLRLQLGLSLLLCAVGPALPAYAGPDTSESLFAGCTAGPLGTDGWSYECRDFNAIISDHPGISAEIVWKHSRRTFEEQAAGRMKFEESSATLAGRKARILRASAKGVQDPEKSTFAVLTVEGKGGRRVLCKTRTAPEQQALCERVLEKLAGNSWQADPEAGATVTKSAAILAGRELSTPAGCKLQAGDGDGRIECSDGSRLDWIHLPETSGLEAFVRNGVKTIKDVALVAYTESRIPCAIDGVRTECTHLRLLEPSSRRDVYFVGTEVRGMAVYISCIAGNSSRQLPHACQQVLSFR